MILAQRIHPVARENIAVDNVVFDVVAVVNHKGELHHQASAVAVAIAASVGVVGWKAVVGSELIQVKPVNNDASTGAQGVGGVILKSSDGVELMLVDAIRVNGEVDYGVGVVGVLVGLGAALKSESGQQGDHIDELGFHAAKVVVFFET